MIHPVPVLLGDGRRLFGAERIELEPTRVLDAPGVTHLTYRLGQSARRSLAGQFADVPQQSSA